jgi:hypothetical protein
MNVLEEIAIKTKKFKYQRVLQLTIRITRIKLDNVITIADLANRTEDTSIAHRPELLRPKCYLQPA